MVPTLELALNSSINFTRPSVSSETADAVLSLLIPLLKPIGDHARERVVTLDEHGEGRKRSKRRTIVDTGVFSKDRPEIFSYLTIGFNSTVRMLEGIGGTSKKTPAAIEQSQKTATDVKDAGCCPTVFVCRSALPEPVSQSFPILIAIASLRIESPQPMRLLELSARAEAAVSAALALPRVSVLAIQQDAPGAGLFLQFIREHVGPVALPWLSEAPSPTYLPVKFNAVKAVIGTKKSTCKRKRALG